MYIKTFFPYYLVTTNINHVKIFHLNQNAVFMDVLSFYGSPSSLLIFLTLNIKVGLVYNILASLN